MDKIGNYKIKPFTKNRRNISLIVHEGWRRHSAHGLVEIDVTIPRKLIKKYQEKTGEKISFTGWIIKCIGKALSEHKQLNALRHGTRKIFVFDDVDVAIPVEKYTVKDVRPMAYIIRKVNEKDIKQISDEIKKVKEEKVDDSTQVLEKNLTFLERFVLSSPIFLKKFFLWFFRKNAILKKKHMGTVGVTSIGMKGRFPGWVVPLGGTTVLLFVIGSITKKPGIVGDKIEVREFLDVTISVDHDIVDGGPLARFVDCLIGLIEEGYGLNSL